MRWIACDEYGSTLAGALRPRASDWRAFAGALALTVVSCAGPGDEAAQSEPAGPGTAEGQVAFDVLAQGDQPAGDVGPKVVGVRIIESADDFARAYRALAGGQPPAIDFDRAVVLALDMGRQASGGYRIAVDSVLRDDGVLTARVVEVEPGAGCVTTQAVTRPYQLVRVPVDDEPVRVERRTLVRDCH
jgi:hypothetical protein